MNDAHDFGMRGSGRDGTLPLRDYTSDSPQARARLVVLAMLADGRLDDAELDSLDRNGTLAALGIDRDAFFTVLYDFCADVEGLPRGDGDYLLAPSVLHKMLAEVSRSDDRETLLRLIFDVIRSDGRLARGEAALFWQAVDTWSIRAAETRAALNRRRRSIAMAVRTSVRPL